MIDRLVVASKNPDKITELEAVLAQEPTTVTLSGAGGTREYKLEVEERLRLPERLWRICCRRSHVVKNANYWFLLPMMSPGDHTLI